MAILLGLAAAGAYGASDFIGGLSSRRASVFAVVLWSQLVGLVALLVLFPALNHSAPTARAFVWGGAAGVGGGIGVLLLYRGLALGRMGVVAPITAVEAASIPVVFGLGTGERPSALALAGVVIALASVALISSSGAQQETATRPARRALDPSIVAALGSGLGFGAFFIFLGHAGHDTGLWPLVATKVSSVTIVLIAAAMAGRGLVPPRHARAGVVSAGVLDVGANVLYLGASRLGLLSIVAVLTSMYPATTVLLARSVLGERFGRLQSIGLLCAVIGVVLIASG